MRELASIKLVLASAGVVVRSEMGWKTSYMGMLNYIFEEQKDIRTIGFALYINQLSCEVIGRAGWEEG